MMPGDEFVELFRSYFKQARDELGLRLLDRLFDADGTKNKWWQVCFLLLMSFLKCSQGFFKKKVHGERVKGLVGFSRVS
jgi:hypothetical protein